jgi:hypothetical protein
METQKERLITGREGGPIDLEVAASWTKNYREKHPDSTISQFFGKEILESILSQEGCLGIRFYYAHDHEGKSHLVITGVTHDGEDQIHDKHQAAPHADPAAPAAPVHKLYEIGDQSTPCPGTPGCPKNLLSVGKV